MAKGNGRLPSARFQSCQSWLGRIARLLLGWCLACASPPASRVPTAARPAPAAAHTLQPSPTEVAAARLAQQKADCERDYDEMEPRTAAESQFDATRLLQGLAARCGSHLGARWERELSSTTGEAQALAWSLLAFYPTALEGTDRERELERLAELADTFARAPNASPIWQDRVALLRARMMAPRCDPADVRAGIKLLQGASYDLEDSDFPASELATQLGECRKLLPASDPLVVEAAAKVSWVYWAFGYQSEDPARRQELLGRAIAEATFVFEQRHQRLPKETPLDDVLVALVAALHQLKRTPEAIQWFELLLADAPFLATQPQFAEALKLVQFDIVYLYAHDLSSREDFAQCATLLSQLVEAAPSARRDMTDEVYVNLGACYEGAGQHLLADKAWSAVKSSQLRAIIEQRRAARKSTSP